MTAGEFTRKKELLAAFEALQRNRAYLSEVRPKIVGQFEDAIAGLRNRDLSREKRDEHLVAAENAESLMKLVEWRISELTKEVEGSHVLTNLDQETE